jgi:hypothetical protein
MTGDIRKALLVAGFICLSGSGGTARAEVALQFFNNTWNEIADKMPEIAEVGYRALWLPPPQKASGDLSVGYDLWDPFDLGGNPQRTGGRTRYGTEVELHRLIEIAHRFGIRVYFDNIMNHRAFDVPGFNENTPIDIYPGMLPEDFHLRVTEDGFYRPWGNTANWQDTWLVQNQNLSGLLDIAHETPNSNFGPNQGDTHPKIEFVRHPNNPEFYDYHPTLGMVGFSSTSITAQVIANNPGFYKENVGSYLMRSIRWLVDRTKLDGLRLDAVKHVPAYFFGEQWAGDKDLSGSGYNGQAQVQYNISRGFSDPNHRDTLFDLELPRDDLMIFGEHMGQPPPYDEYWASGMRLLDARNHSTLNDRLGKPGANLSGLQFADYVDGVQMGRALGVLYAKSHDDDVAYRSELHYALNLTRAGLPVIYTDGNRQAETLGQSGGAFPRHANTAYLGQFGDNRIPNLVYIHEQFARGDHIPRWADEDVVAFERRDKRDNFPMPDADGTAGMLIINDNYAAGSYREIPTSFPNGSHLWQYSTGGGNFYHVVADGKVKVTTPPGGYFFFSWRSPEESELWKFSGGRPITIYENGKEAGFVSYVRKDGPDGDPAFNPYGVYDTNATDYAYTWYLPRVSSATNLEFIARVDGSANNVMMKLNGGINLNTNNHFLGDPRDNPPALSTDIYLGYESVDFMGRFGPEKFAANDSIRNKIGSAGAETYQFTVGTTNFTIYEANASNNFDSTYTAAFVYHNPTAQTDANPSSNTLSQFWPPPQDSTDSPLYLWIKSGGQGTANRMYIYYTTDGVSWPDGAAGRGIGNTKVVEVFWQFNSGDGNDWWGESVIPAQPAGTTVRYKIGATRQQGYSGAPWDVPFPNSFFDIDRKTKMLGVWGVTNFNAANVVYRPHNDYGTYRTGLVEGFNIIRARTFLQRDGLAITNGSNGLRTPIYNTFTQPFYYDALPPTGEIKFPIAGQTIYDNRYEFVIRTDPTVTKVFYNIVDNSVINDDGQTGQRQGNGTNALGQSSWVEATRVSPSLSIISNYEAEWRLTYNNIPSSGTAMIFVKLAELSSSTNPLVSDQDGRFTTLARQVNTLGPNYNMFVAWPQNDGDLVGVPYDMKLHFSESLWGGANTDELVRNRFLVTINGIAQSRTNYNLNWMGGGNGNHELVMRLPDLWNGDPNYLHDIQITHTNAGGGGVTLFASRRVKAVKSSSGPVVEIVNPPQFDLDAAPFRIVLSDVAAPTPEQRQYTVLVQTDLSAKNVWLTFPGSSATAAAVISATNALTGTVQVWNGSNAVRGIGTKFDEEVAAGSALRLGTNQVYVSQVTTATNLTLIENFSGVNATNLTASLITGNPVRIGNKFQWRFIWSNMTAGAYTIVANVDTNNNTGSIEASVERTTTVILRQRVTENLNDNDDDDDGLSDADETTPVPLPSTNPESWVNGDVHKHYFSGNTDPLSPDSDGDGLHDALELGLGGPIASDTDINMDTNGDGWKNFMSDIDPPVFNTTDNWAHPRYDLNRGRTDMIQGSMTDPNNPDTDYDNLMDGIEDANRNGRVDVGLLDNGTVTSIINTPTTVRGSSRIDRDALPNNAVLLETDPNNGDTDEDGRSDGQEDLNSNGRVDIALVSGNITSLLTYAQVPHFGTNINGMVSRAINRTALTNWYSAADLRWLETDPLNRDTDGDGLPDGWEYQYGLDPLDNGIINLRTGGPGNPDQGGTGDPDDDDFSNLTEYLNGTHPLMPDDLPDPPEGSVSIGRGPEIGTINGKTYYQEFMDWTWDDLRALDPYEGDGPNREGGDTFLAYDGFDSSRDIVAFYSRDGGDDGKFYFRVDFQDLAALAEEGNLDLYVVIDTGNPANGERVLPDEVDTITDMNWEVVVGVYHSALGSVYVDNNLLNNTTTFGQDIFSIGGVVNRPDYFHGAYFNSKLDAVEFAISRQALIDVGWNGNPNTLNFQVYTTKEGTCNSCADGKPGAGDLGGRSDIRDTIWNDYIAEDFSEAQAGLRGENSLLRNWIPGSSRGGRSKLAMLVHGNQPIQPGSVTHSLINNGAGAGYYRVLDSHQLFGQSMNLHITPTLASAIQWAKVDPSANAPWLDGPSLNERIRTMAHTNQIALLASTFSDHMMPYFTTAFNVDNIRLASEFLENLYQVPMNSNRVFWTPERLLDADVLSKIKAAGFQSTVIDQMEHLQTWVGRSEALGTRGYQMNRFEDVLTFPINNTASDFRFGNIDGGLNLSLRSLFNRKARGAWDQVVTIFSPWEDFANNSNADAYDVNLQWIANRPWIHLVKLEDVKNNKVDLTGDGQGDAWFFEERPTIVGQPKKSHNYINYATQGSYDQWYVGDTKEEGLLGKIFDIRPGTPMSQTYGMLFTGGVVSDSWERVVGIIDTNLAKVARSTMHASVFQTAFHTQPSVDLRKFSNGEYINPDTSSNRVASFAGIAQAQSRQAALFKRVDTWLSTAASMTNTATELFDVDLDGENEYLLLNNRMLAIMERSGGRMVGAWVRDTANGSVYQTIGNTVANSGSWTEQEGSYNVETNGTVVAYRTSALKDWWAGTATYVNDLYTFTNWTNGWRITSADGKIQKTISLGAGQNQFNVSYTVDPSLNGGVLYVRNGLSPNLYDLLKNGQNNLSAEQYDGNQMTLVNQGSGASVSAIVGYSGASINPMAVDDNPEAGVDFRTMPRRNQAQVHQVELYGTNSFSFTLGFTVSAAGIIDTDGDGIPDWWELQYFNGTTNAQTGVDNDGDGVSNWDEFVAGTSPTNGNEFFELVQTANSTGITLWFPTATQRQYRVWYVNHSVMATNWTATPSTINGTGGTVQWTDDGSATVPHPNQVTNRYYKIDVELTP